VFVRGEPPLEAELVEVHTPRFAGWVIKADVRSLSLPVRRSTGPFGRVQG